MKSTLQYLTLIALTLAAPLASKAQTTIFTDNFTTDGSLASEWYNLSNSTVTGVALNPTANQGLALTVPIGSSGKVNEEFAQFTGTPVTLATIGDYITLTVDFNSPNFTNVSTADTGGLLTGLFYSQGTAPSANEESLQTGGATANDTGYFGIMGANTSAGTSTKFFSRQGSPTATNELGYYSIIGAGNYTQLSSSLASTNANLANNTAYVLTYTIKKTGANSDTITAIISQGATQLDGWTSTDASGLYNTFDTLDFGGYGKNQGLDLNITQINVADLIQAVPEPSTLALSGLGLLGFATRFRRARG
jgi:hypothetical protein